MPRIEHREKHARLIADITVDGEVRPVWFEVEERYGQYLCHERSDAFLIGVLNFAQRGGYDITCEAPVTAHLLYQLRVDLIPSLVRNSKKIYATQITAPIAEPLPNAGGVGTGVSCGVDSFHAIKNQSSSPYPGLKLTHLVLNNVGSFLTEDQYSWQKKHVLNFAKEYGFELIVTNSNFLEQIPHNHTLSHTYSDCFCIYALQKLWSVYFYSSSGYDYQHGFTLKDSEINDSCYHELLALNVFSTPSLRIYSEGGAITRMEKQQALVDWEPAQKYLHVCYSAEGPNCGHCNKCRRTLTMLDALGALDKFAQSFDIATYRANRKDYLRWLYVQHALPRGDHMTDPTYEILKTDVLASTNLIWRSRYLLEGFLRRRSTLHAIIKSLKTLLHRTK